MRAAMAGSSKATVTAVGWPWATSRAKLGPLRGADGELETDLGRVCSDDLGHAQEGLVFNAFGGADDDLAGAQMRADAGECGAEEF